MFGAALFGTSVLLSKLTPNIHQKKKNGVRSPFNDHDYEDELAVAIQIAKAAGSHLKENLHGAKRITSKDADKAGKSSHCTCDVLS